MRHPTRLRTSSGTRSPRSDPNLQLRLPVFVVDRVQLAGSDQRVVRSQSDAEDLGAVTGANRIEPPLMLLSRRRVEARVEQDELTIGDPAVEDVGILLSEGRQDDRFASQHLCGL